MPKKFLLAVRYIQLFDLPTGTEVFCNRGTAGIDGSTATAMGAAQINPKKTVLITGDLSFFYDVNGLWNDYIPRDARIIVINNQGGGIFRILAGDKDTPKYDTYFETIHNRNFKNVAKSFGLGVVLHYLSPNSNSIPFAIAIKATKTKSFLYRRWAALKCALRLTVNLFILI